MKKLKDIPEMTLKEFTHNTDQLYLKDGIIYKIFNENSFIQEKERNISFIMNNPIPNTPEIYDKFYEGNNFIGYSMKYIPDTITFREGIRKDIPMSHKRKAIKDVYEAMKCFHTKNIYFGDIHSDNMLISKNGEGYLIDLEELRFPGDEFKFKQYYLVKPNNKSYRINIPDQYTDNVKLMLCSLSLLLNQDLEKYISNKSHDINLEQIYKEIIIPLNNKKLEKYFQKLMNEDNVDYFSDYYLSEEKQEEFKKVKR